MRFRGLSWFLAGTLGFIFLAAQSRATWLPWIAESLIIVEDQLRNADLIVVFSAEEERSRHAALLFRQGLAPRVLATGGLASKAIELFCGQKVTGAELTARSLTVTGVPKQAVIILPLGTSTYEEAEAIRAFMKTNGYRSVIAVSSPYHMRRIKATFEHLLQGTEIAVQYSPAAGSDFNTREWWKHERNLIQVTNEYLKLAYYHLSLF